MAIYTREFKEEVIAHLQENNASMYATAEKFGVSAMSVAQWRQRMTLEPGNRVKVKINDLIDDYRLFPTITATERAKKFGVSSSCICILAKEYNLRRKYDIPPLCIDFTTRASNRKVTPAMVELFNTLAATREHTIKEILRKVGIRLATYSHIRRVASQGKQD